MPKRKKRKSDMPPAAEKIAKTLLTEMDMPIAAISGISHMEISGNNEAVIQGCQGVLEYNDDCIRLNLGRRSVVFRGCDLVMQSYSAEQVIVEGNIAVIEFL